jgi:signal transduction histidine kinase
MIDVTVRDLLLIPALGDVPESQLQWFIDESDHYVLQEGESLGKEGEDITGTHIIVYGHLEFYRTQNNAKLVVAELVKGAITGTLPFSRAKVNIGSGICREETQIMTFPKAKLRHMIALHYELTQALVIVMTSRVREFTELEQQNEKMMALGKLSAGLAHELNNPASAIVRGAATLKKHLEIEPESFKRLISIRMAAEEIDYVNNKLTVALHSKDRPILTMMQRSDLEDDVTDWLESNDANQCADMAENFVEFGFEVNELDQIRSRISGIDLTPVLTWMNNTITTQRMVTDIQDASKRIADLIGSVKNYTHMDRGRSKEYLDIHTGIRNTLTMLNYKIKKANITLIEDFDQTIPPVNAMVGELNQVWTNLIDNATDALESQPDSKLTIRTRQEMNFVKIFIIDNGPGIPTEIKTRIFDPFFTTKDIGKGTGLGLDVVNRIVKQHNGSITVHSEPSNTEFLVCFPIHG